MDKDIAGLHSDWLLTQTIVFVLTEILELDALDEVGRANEHFEWSGCANLQITLKQS